MQVQLSNKELLLSRKDCWIRFAGAEAGRAAEFRVVRVLDSGRAVSRVGGLRIRALRALERSPDESWVQWAVDELVAGEDTPSLRILAGLGPPLQYFDTVEIADRALQETGLGPVSYEEALATYAAAVLEEAVAREEMSRGVLKELADIYLASGLLHELQRFYLLYHAWTDLEYSGSQRYWPGADLSNIVAVSLSEARAFIADWSAL